MSSEQPLRKLMQKNGVKFQHETPDNSQQARRPQNALVNIYGVDQTKHEQPNLEEYEAAQRIMGPKYIRRNQFSERQREAIDMGMSPDMVIMPEKSTSQRGYRPRINPDEYQKRSSYYKQNQL